MDNLFDYRPPLPIPKAPAYQKLDLATETRSVTARCLGEEHVHPGLDEPPVFRLLCQDFALFVHAVRFHRISPPTYSSVFAQNKKRGGKLIFEPLAPNLQPLAKSTSFVYSLESV
jgi:hypothetical protein